MFNYVDRALLTSYRLACGFWEIDGGIGHSDMYPGYIARDLRKVSGYLDAYQDTLPRSEVQRPSHQHRNCETM